MSNNMNSNLMEESLYNLKNGYNLKQIKLIIKLTKI